MTEENPAVLRAQVDDLRERIAAEQFEKAKREAAATDEYRSQQLANERDRLRVELAALTGVEPSDVPLVSSAPAPEPEEALPVAPEVPVDSTGAPIQGVVAVEETPVPTNSGKNR